MLGRTALLRPLSEFLQPAHCLSGGQILDSMLQLSTPQQGNMPLEFLLRTPRLLRRWAHRSSKPSQTSYNLILADVYLDCRYAFVWDWHCFPEIFSCKKRDFFLQGQRPEDRFKVRIHSRQSMIQKRTVY